MLTVAEARKHLGTHCPLTDHDIQAMLDQLQRIAQLALVAAEREHDEAPTPYVVADKPVP